MTHDLPFTDPPADDVLVGENEDGRAYAEFDAVLGKTQNMIDAGWKFDASSGRDTLAAAALLMGLRGVLVRVTIQEIGREDD